MQSASVKQNVQQLCSKPVDITLVDGLSSISTKQGHSTDRLAAIWFGVCSLTGLNISSHDSKITEQKIIIDL